MKVLVIGSGGREHAICEAFGRSPRTTEIYCAQGNAGIGRIAVRVPIAPEDVLGLADFAEREGIGLTFVGGETALAAGVVDEFESRGLRIVGASRAAARLESSKSFAKDFMARHGIPTAAYRTAFSTREAKAILGSGAFGDEGTAVVVKADGLAAGKGVVVAADRSEALLAVDELEAATGAAAQKIVLEECLVGREVSLLAFSDGSDFSLMPPVRDHKRIGEGDTGPNTGGMGTISDDSLLTAGQTEEVIRTVIRPTLAGCAVEGFPFRGILFVGLMMTEAGPRVLEYNVRFGDPETQVILVRMETDFVDVCEALIEGRLGATPLSWKRGSAACVVLAARGYPQRAQTGDIIYGLDLAAKHSDVSVFHAGTSVDEKGHAVTAGGRVLGVTAVGDNLAQALERAYLAVNDISWNGMQFRRDIGS